MLLKTLAICDGNCYNKKDIEKERKKGANKNERNHKKNKLHKQSKCFLNRCFIFIYILNKEVYSLFFFAQIKKKGRIK